MISCDMHRNCAQILVMNLHHSSYGDKLLNQMLEHRPKRFSEWQPATNKIQIEWLAFLWHCATL